MGIGSSIMTDVRPCNFKGYPIKPVPVILQSTSTLFLPRIGLTAMYLATVIIS